VDLRAIPLEKIEFDSQQPRKHFREENIKSLAQSIEQIGQIQPVIVKEEKEKFYLIAGERRVRALKEKNQKNVWAMILKEDADPERCRLIQLAENLQRENLNPLERAQAVKHYIETGDLTKKEASRRLGIPRTTINDWLNILEVEPFYQEKVLENFYGQDSPLTLSHLSLARALQSNSSDPSRKKILLDQILKHNLSRKETREIVEACSKDPLLQVEEAVAGILIRREQRKIEKEREEKDKDVDIKDLKKAFDRLEGIITEIMNSRHELLKENREAVIEEFRYLGQLLEQAIPGGLEAAALSQEEEGEDIG